jgi:uncharacterized protein YndB with AHSA1/START domain
MEPVVLKRVLPCSKRQLFDAWSKASIMSQWFFAHQNCTTPSTVNNSFTVGGDYEVIMHMETGDHRHYGTYRAIDRFNHIAFTWNSHIVKASLVDLDFRALSPNRTELTLTHSQFPGEDVRAMHAAGWEGCLGNLVRFVEEQIGSEHEVPM